MALPSRLQECWPRRESRAALRGPKPWDSGRGLLCSTGCFMLSVPFGGHAVCAAGMTGGGTGALTPDDRRPDGIPQQPPPRPSTLDSYVLIFTQNKT